MNWYLKVIRDNYANFEGRARRMEYWMFTLFHTIILFGLAFFSGVLAFDSDGFGTIPLILFLIYFLGTLLPSIAVTVRRLHDTGNTGWLYLINFIPYVGGLVIFVFYGPGR